MNDHDLDRLVASAAPVRDTWLDRLDLRDAESELMEEIMATGRAPETTSPGPSPTDGPLDEVPSHFDRAPDARGRRANGRRFAIAAGLVAAALVGTVLVRASGGGDDTDVSAGSPPPISPMIADPLPEGFGVSMVYPEEGSDPPRVSPGSADTAVYGDLTATAITNDIVIRVATDEPDLPEGAEVVGEDVSVRGAEGTLCTPGPNQCDFGDNVTGVSWTEGPGLDISVESRTYDRNQVLAIAEGLVVDGDTVELGDLPAGVARPPKVAEVDDSWTDEYTVEYLSAAGGYLSVSTRAETEAMRVYDLWLAGRRDDTVHGRPATFEDIDGSYVLTWEAVPGQLVEVLTNGVDEATARAFAETVRPATDAEWADVQEQAGSAPPLEDDLGAVESPPADAAHRQLADGSTEVWGWRNDDGGLCYQVAAEGAVSETLCGGDPATDALGVSPLNEDGELSWTAPAAVGVAPDGTVSIDGGEVTLGEQVDGGRLFVWEFPEGEMPESLTFRDVGGNELATADVVVF